MANALCISRYHHEGHCHRYATAPPLCSGKVQSQTIPYISFMVLNHSYINLTLVGDEEDGSDSVQCHTDLSHTE